MLSPLRLSHAAALALSAVGLVVAVPPATHAGLTVYYQEDFTGQAGEGITNGGTSYSNASWSVNGTDSPVAMGHAQVVGGVFEFSDVGGTGQPTATGTVVFETLAATIAVGNPSFFSHLRMTLDAVLTDPSFADGEFLRIESFINGNIVETTDLIAATAGLQVTHNLLDHISQPGSYQYVLRVTSVQQANGNPSHTIDNILVEGLSVPEPASMSLLGMGVAAMVTARYRRRQKSAV